MKGERMIILIDQDGVLANYEERMLDIFHEEHPEIPRIPHEELTEFNTHKAYSEEYWEEIENIALRPDFFRSLPPIDGAIEGVQELLRLGVGVRICTAPKKIFKHCVGEKYEWIHRHFGQKMVNKITLTRDKTLVRGEILIDDKPEITGSRKPEWEHVLFDQPYNRHIEDKRRLNWQNFREVLGL